MGKGCLTVSKYFLFLFNLIFFLLGGAVLGFGLWLLLDNESFTVVISKCRIRLPVFLTNSAHFPAQTFQITSHSEETHSPETLQNNVSNAATPPPDSPLGGVSE
ncbi:hypothetical protein CCH79_00018935 [Gambusia affinis]|uniref:Uncharacterized protein n=1 Tax=Gambusia affinis TaxID=33528 RepID=A0A315VJN0_GAMAF|nr:hypothetical protein CCH79_00018935 [Gambusia affinis]